MGEDELKAFVDGTTGRAAHVELKRTQAHSWRANCRLSTVLPYHILLTITKRGIRGADTKKFSSACQQLREEATPGQAAETIPTGPAAPSPPSGSRGAPQLLLGQMAKS